jgi:hypothetical protein
MSIKQEEQTAKTVSTSEMKNCDRGNESVSVLLTRSMFEVKTFKTIECPRLLEWPLVEPSLTRLTWTQFCAFPVFHCIAIPGFAAAVLILATPDGLAFVVLAILLRFIMALKQQQFPPILFLLLLVIFLLRDLMTLVVNWTIVSGILMIAHCLCREAPPVVSTSVLRSAFLVSEDDDVEHQETSDSSKLQW